MYLYQLVIITSIKRLSKYNTMVYVQVLVSTTSNPFNGFPSYIQLDNNHFEKTISLQTLTVYL